MSRVAPLSQVVQLDFALFIDWLAPSLRARNPLTESLSYSISS